MKSMKKLLAFALVLVMLSGLALTASAASITIERDSTYAGEADTDGGRVFTYNQIFRATLTGANTASGGGYDTDGTPGSITNTLTKGYSYYLNSTDTAQIGALGTWDATAKTWTKAAGNLWFDLTPSADGKQYIVTWANGVATDADTAQAAAKWLAANYTPVATGTLTWNETDKKWSATGLADGYYLISSVGGDNLVAATNDITIKEKNSYPPLDKTQADEDDNVQTDQDKKVAVGDVLTYNVKVTIPATAKVNETIVVYDKPSAGLKYNDDVAVTSNDGFATISDGTLETGDAWRKVITVTESSKGKDVIFTCTMTVTAEALAGADKINDSGLVYNNYESKPDSVKFETYYAGIFKYDGDSADETPLEGVKFTLKEDGVEFKVSKVADKDYYIPDANGSSEVVTDAKGLIRIRGLDDDKTYTLTETETLPGFNLLPNDVTLTLTLDTVTEADGTTTSSYDEAGKANEKWGDKVVNNKGTVLPSTGGIGTTLFYILGTILVLGAGVVLVTKRRVQE